MADLVSPKRDVRWLGQRLRNRHAELAARWLEHLEALLVIERRESLPTEQLVNHMPGVTAHLAAVLDGTAEDAENAEILQRAAVLGRLRYQQRATIRQVLCEFQALTTVIDQFVEDEVARAGSFDPIGLLRALRQVQEAIGRLRHNTVDAFFAEYTQTIERQTEQLRRFSRLVSHEMRQPLAVLQVIAKTLPVPSGDLEAARMMDIFERNVSRLGDVTRELERLARITPATDMAPNEHETDLSEVAHAAARQLSDLASAHGVEVIVAAKLPTVRLDAARAELVLMNLLANAIKYSDPAKPRRYVEVYPAEGDIASVIVRDNGIGIAAPRLQHIFREFVRAHAQRDDDLVPRGLGLGLSIVRDCMDAANGAVRVESLAGRGTTFKLTWPPR
jgi:signal transduction histidine kinase